ncbi:MAG: isoleucine--tRNA ligase [Candidatus Muiribacterium halophilum]|uniref:Isoleucine--tRNA ligase n=1 Tax=Muiribacterium halophilum TaxID=2053465 RepID=A0A2N5ZHR3_MUIH1|nr:MAG: isoleucine--tRNA ligase [Candidatus Muirbacterium halophilum]
MFKPVDSKLNFSEDEQKILEFWEKNEIFRKTLEHSSKNPRFVFYEGPPTANGKPHPGHILGRAIKDVFNRYKTMKGFHVPRKAGWDTHGLPVEIEVEKKLGLDGKEQIEEYGVEKFIKHCKESVFTYKEEWEKMTTRLGFWVDMDNPYITMDNKYVESIWGALKKIFDKDMLYFGHKILPYCPRCGTALSSHEVAQGYRQTKDPSVFVKMKIANEDAHFLVWTTTPWTLISNVALAINRDEKYVRIKTHDDQELILAKKRLEVIDGDYEIIQEFDGKTIEGKKYEQLFEYCVKPESKNGFIVVHADYVSMDDGTGIVHIAPAFGEDDYQVGQKHNLAFFQPIDLQGRFEDIVEEFKGMFVKDADPEIITRLKRRELMYRSQKVEHTYPFCWRCDSPLLYYARQSWFIRMSEIRDKLLKNNQEINWYPEYIKDGRFGNFLENVIDWAISRERYWGTPLNIWVCEDDACDHKISIGSIAELKEKGINCPDDIELHKPYVDNVEIKCEKCGKTMRRVSEVIDCWFDSGCMHTAQWHYPFENQDEFDKSMPADFISEGIDQTRGWFYSLLATSTLLYDKAPYKNCLVTAHVLGKDGLKMSKSKGNTVDPWDVFNKQGSDAVRWYFYVSSPAWVPKAFYPEAITEAIQKFLGTLKNLYSFFVLYANIDKYEPGKFKSPKDLPLLDKWVISYFNDTVKEVEEHMERFDLTKTTRKIQSFVDDLSNWYLRRSRRRFWASDMNEDKISAYNTLYSVLVELSKLVAPFVPFIAEEIYQNLVRSFDDKAPESVHMTDFPAWDEKKIDNDLHTLMEATMKIVGMGRAARNESKIKNRQPLSDVTVGGLSTDVEKMLDSTKELILDELNIKEVSFAKDNSKFVDFDLTPNFKTLGPKYGKLVNKIKQHLVNMPEEAKNSIGHDLLNNKEVIVNIENNEIKLSPDDLNIISKGKADFSVITEGEVFVALNTHITQELLQEGYIRELVNKIQNMRKDAGFEVMDRIEISILGDDEISKAFEAFGAYLVKETLCDKVYFNERDGFIYKEWDINGKQIKIAVKKQ